MQGLRILVVEDEFLLAEDLRQALEGAGVVVLGPVASLAKAQARVLTESTIHGAVLDINVGGQRIFPLADVLMDRGVPFVFVSGYDIGVVPPRFTGIPLLQKPVSLDALTSALMALIKRG
ncbi:response regulator [soil metagenome]